MIRNYTITGVSPSLEFGKRGGKIECINDTFELKGRNGVLMPLIVGASDDENAVVSKKQLEEKIVEIQNSHIAKQVLTVQKSNIVLDDFEDHSGLLTNKEQGNISLLDANNNVKTILNSEQTDQRYWKSENAGNIYISDTDPALSQNVPEGSIWFRT
jgi:hypothetical protein